MNGEPLLTVKDLCVDYRTSRERTVPAVNNVNLTVVAGEVVALIGESGSGKSTLGQALVRLLPANARIMGEAWWSGGAEAVDLLSISVENLKLIRWASVAYVPQASLNSFNPVLTIADHFSETARAHRFNDGLLRDRALTLLKEVRLDASRVWRSYPHQLSGGSRQRVAIALAMLLKPRLLILDEPTTALDVITQRAVLEILLDLRASTGTSMLFISHDLGIACHLADRVATMYAGHLVEDASAADVVRDPWHPYSRALLNAVPSVRDTDTVAVPIAGDPPDLTNLPAGCAFHPRCPVALQVCRSDPFPSLVSMQGHRRVACHVAVAKHTEVDRLPDSIMRTAR